MTGLTVGEFSRVSHLSIKTLRHYHEVGLLAPAEIAPDTGYRYYSLDQVPTAQVIRRLRNLEMPVADVKAVLSAEDVTTRNELISAHLARLETRLAQAQTAIESLRELRRGYVLRRLIRRVLTTLWRDDPTRTLSDLPMELIEHTLGHFRQLRDPYEVRTVLLDEERKFGVLLQRGRQVLSRSRFTGTLSDEDYRYLHDTHGLPRDLVVYLNTEQS
ncbi:MerR family transcriptional regulator [Nocardia sp. NPDC020380]|uniref:MerR family transcriptional regulator n=1 Tax=Nocardia sp. NPDC020380 TaxID=3364309 RepID=UPI0037B86D89